MASPTFLILLACVQVAAAQLRGRLSALPDAMHLFSMIRERSFMKEVTGVTSRITPISVLQNDTTSGEYFVWQQSLTNDCDWDFNTLIATDLCLGDFKLQCREDDDDNDDPVDDDNGNNDDDPADDDQANDDNGNNDDDPADDDQADDDNGNNGDDQANDDNGNNDDDQADDDIFSRARVAGKAGRKRMPVAAKQVEPEIDYYNPFVSVNCSGRAAETEDFDDNFCEPYNVSASTEPPFWVSFRCGIPPGVLVIPDCGDPNEPFWIAYMIRTNKCIQGVEYTCQGNGNTVVSFYDSNNCSGQPSEQTVIDAGDCVQDGTYVCLE